MKIFGQLQRLLGGGSTEQPSPAATALSNDPKVIARSIEAADETKLNELALRLAPALIPAILRELSATDKKVALVVAVLQQRMPGHDTLRAIAKELDPLARGQVLLFAGAARSKLEAAGFAQSLAPQLASSTAVDRARLLAQANVALPPLLASFIAKNDFAPRIASVRAGVPGLTADEKSQVRNQLEDLDAAQMKVLREILVERPPHPQLKQMNGHWALKGPPSTAGLLAILSGEPLGLKPYASAELLHRAGKVLDVLISPAEPELKQQWLDYLSSSDIAVTFAEGRGVQAFVAMSELGLTTIEVACGAEWGRQHALTVALANAAKGEVKSWVAQHGARALGEALHALEHASWKGPSLEIGSLVRTLGFDRAVKLARVLEDEANHHGLRALRVLRGGDSDALIQSLIHKSEGEIRALCDDATRQIPRFGAFGAPLYGSASRPPLSVPRTSRVAAEDTVLLAGSGIDPAVLATSKHNFSSAQLSWVANKMRRAIWEKDPALLAQLDRELEGRRFVSFRYYDELYAIGIKNPEHRYSVQTFESWSAADRVVTQRAKASRGRPLEEGELLSVMREVHALVGRGMIEVGETHMKEADLGRIRSIAEDSVQLGNGLHRVGANTAFILAKNPYLQRFLPFEDLRPNDEGKYARFIVFSEGNKVPELVRELEKWVRENEGKIPAEELAAEVHFRLVSIHPFMDGNGRSSKLIADFLLARAGIRPPVWREGDVMKHQDRWPRVVRDGIEYDLSTVERYYRTMIERAP